MLKKSVIIAGRHSTSISLVEEFFTELKLIAAARKMTINGLVTEIDASRINPNLSSAIRIYILNYLKNNPGKNIRG